MNIAIIGNSEIGMAYAKGFALAGHRVYIAWQNSDAKTESTIPDMLGHVEVCSLEYASAVADLVILATQPKDVREAVYWLGDVRRKVIIDATANVHTQEEDLVHTANAIKAITGSQHLVKMFYTKGYEDQVRPLFGHNPVELILVGDSKKAKEITKIMAVELGINLWYDFGGTDTLPLFNQLTQVLRRNKLAEKQDVKHATR